MLQSDDLIKPGDSVRVRIRVRGFYDVAHVNRIEKLIRAGGQPPSLFQVTDFTAQSDDQTTLTYVPMQSGNPENYSLYVTFLRTDWLPGLTLKVPAGTGSNDPIYQDASLWGVGIVVGLILALLIGLVAVLGWQAEKIQPIFKSANISLVLIAAIAAILIFGGGLRRVPSI